MLRNEFGKTAKARCSKIETNVAAYSEQDELTKILRSTTISGAYVTDLDEIQRHLHGIN